MRKLTALIPAGLIGTALMLAATVLPADASTGSMCTAFGAFLCTGVPDSDFGVGGQMISVHQPGRTMVFNAGVGGTATIHFASATGLCIAPSAGSDNVKIVLCNAAGVSWKKVQGPTAYYFVNVRYGGYLTGFDQVGSILAACPHPCPGGGEQQWRGPA
jgi:hypothetical protein